MATDATATAPQHRLSAVVALISGVAALIAVLAFTIDSFWNLLIALIGAAVVVTGGWYVVANRGTRRFVAALVAALGVVLVVLGLVGAGSGLLQLFVAGVLMAVSIVFAQHATKRRPTSVTAADLAAPHQPAKNPVLIMNPWSGGGKVDRFNLVQECRDRGIEPVVLAKGDDLIELAEDAIARGADVIGMAGGDGSQALVATVAMRHGVPHVVIPAGTRNHLGPRPRPGPG